MSYRSVSGEITLVPCMTTRLYPAGGPTILDNWEPETIPHPKYPEPSQIWSVFVKSLQVKSTAAPYWIMDPHAAGVLRNLDAWAMDKTDQAKSSAQPLYKTFKGQHTWPWAAPTAVPCWIMTPFNAGAKTPQGNLGTEQITILLTHRSMSN